MHGHEPYDVFLHKIAGFLGSYYLLLSLMNLVMAFILWQRPNQRTLFRLPGMKVPVTDAFVWLLVSLAFLLIAPLAYSGDPAIVSFITVPAAARAAINRAMNPTIYITGTVVLLLVLFLLRRVFVRPAGGWALVTFALLVVGMSRPDQNFSGIVAEAGDGPRVAV